jgi:4,5-DOPA dioxygenase extradiol
MTTPLMPALFVGHGSPMNAIEDNEFSRAWQVAGAALPRPKAILCVSAHWETRGAWVTAMPQPRTIYDFYGFPKALYQVSYPAPGLPGFAEQINRVIEQTTVQEDQSWGLDHGAWSVLCRMFPQADIPVVQLSLDRTRDAAYHYQLGRELRALREAGVLLVGSGNIVHNLRVMAWQDAAFEWALDYDRKLEGWMLARDHKPVIEYEKNGPDAALAINSAEHYLPLLYVLGASQPDEPLSFFADKVTLGSISMRCIQVG